MQLVTGKWLHRNGVWMIHWNIHISICDYCTLQPPTYQTPAAVLDSEPQLTDLMDKIAAKVPDQWRNIGIGLGLTVPELNCLPRQGLTPMECFSHIFTTWKGRMTVSYSWKKIIQILKSPSVGQIRLAKDLTAELKASIRRSYRYIITCYSSCYIYSQES